MNDPQPSPSPEELLEAIRAMRQRLAGLEQAVSRMQRAAAAQPPTKPPTEEARPAAPAPPATKPPPVLTPAVEALVGAAAEGPPQAAERPPTPPAEPVPEGAAPAAAPSAEPVSTTITETPAAAARRPGLSLEQTLGTRWMLYVGIVVVLIAGFFFFQYAFERGWISREVRLLAGAAAGLVMIAIGQWALIRRKLRLFAAGIMGGGIVLLYFVVFVASPNGWYGPYDIIGSETAFALMCVVTALGMGLSLQTGMLSSSVISLIGAFATPVLLSTGENRQVFLMCYVLLVNAGFLAVGLVKGWRILGPMALVGAAAIFAGWYAQHFRDAAWPRTCLFGWLFLAEFLAYVCVGSVAKRIESTWAKALGLCAGSGALVLWLVMFGAMPVGWFLFCAAALAAAGLAVGTWRNWRDFCIGSLAWSAVGLTWQAASADSHQTTLMCYLLDVTAVPLYIALARRWKELAPLALIQAVIVVAVWFARHFQQEAWRATNLFAWLLAAELITFVVIGAVKERLERHWVEGLTFFTGSAAVILWLYMFDAMPAAWFLSCVTVMAAVALVIGVWRGGRAVTIAALAWCMIAFFRQAIGPEDHQAMLMCFLLAVNTAVLIVALAKRWVELAPLALLGSVLVFGAWHAWHFEAAAWSTSNLFAWLLLGEFVAWTCLASATDRLEAPFCQTLIVLAGSAAAAVWLVMIESMPATWLLGNVLALVVVTLAIGLWRNWDWPCGAAFAWSAVALLAELLYKYQPDMPLADRWFLAIWAWVFFAVFSVHVFVRAFWKRRPTAEYLHASIGTLAMAGMFALTYGLLRGPYRDWMGGYTAALGAAAIAAAWVLRHLAGRRKLAYAYLGQGLVLLALAAPIQFDRAAVPITWAVQGVVVMFLARRLKNLLLLVKSPVVLALAVMHFFAKSLPEDPRLGETMFVFCQTPVTFGLLLALGLTAAILAAAAILRAGKAILNDYLEYPLAVVMVVAAAGLLALRTGLELPVTGATWCWGALTAGLAAAAIWRRSDWLGLTAGIALLIVAAKWALFDTLTLWAAFGPDTAPVPVGNWQCLAGVLTAAGMLAYLHALRRRLAATWDMLGPSFNRKACEVVVGILAAVMIVYAGSFEIDRYFASGRLAWQDPFQAKQTAYSIWWAVYATVLIILGFVRSSRPVRYLALVLFTVTLVKVFLVDMARVEAVYRILSFLCLGTLLLAGSWLYHRYFREKLAA